MSELSNLPIDESPSCAWRSALDPAASCAACGQSICDHSDLEYQGLLPRAEAQTMTTSQEPNP